jgi:hypothetical protein
MPVPLHRGQKNGEQGSQPLAANTVGCLPRYDKGAARRLVIERRALACLAAFACRWSVEHLDGRLLVISGSGNELAQDPALLRALCRPISSPNHIGEFRPHLVRHLAGRNASQVMKATCLHTLLSVTSQVRQRPGFGNISAEAMRHAYPKYVLKRLPTHSASRIDEPPPHH